MRLARVGYIVIAFAVAVFAAGIAFVAHPTGAGLDVSGAWSTRFALACSGSFTQSGSDLSGTIDCASGIRVNLTGTFHSATGTTTLTGDFGGVPVTVNGRVSSDGISLAGTWSAPPVVTDGPFVARRENEGSTTDLTGFWIISVQHIFSDSCVVDVDQNALEILSGTVVCAGGPSGTLAGTLSAGQMSLSGPFGSYPSLHMQVRIDGESFFGLWVIDPSGPSGTMEGERLGGGTPTQTPTPGRGDVNGDGAVDSVDASIILQYSAGLFSPAPQNADVDGDGRVNAIDASLILQYVAGLLHSLPP